MVNKPAYAIFCDFDGTISRRDVGYNLFKHFSGGRNSQFIPAWKSGSMSSREILTAEAALVNGTEQEIRAFVQDFQIDPAFSEFTRQCDAAGVPLQILSDGLEMYIEAILRRENLAHLPFTANRGVFANGGIRVKFPHDNLHCTRCGSCKGERIREYRTRHAGEIVTVFIGDGMSDCCATKEADLLFAKKDLEVYCRRHDISFIPYENFNDILLELQKRGVLRGVQQER